MNGGLNADFAAPLQSRKSDAEKPVKRFDLMMPRIRLDLVVGRGGPERRRYLTTR